MPISVRIDPISGPVSSNNPASGFSLERAANHRGFSPFAVDSVLTITSASTLDAAACGLNTLSSSAVFTTVLPKASAVPGASMIFRNLCTNAMTITSSQETAGSKVFITQHSGVAVSAQRIVIPGVVNASLMLKSDGANFHVISFSGSLTYA